ncbi:hypothetical protein GALMADRAFT_229106 [Galerina marginata CBS 339.88]|uniref:Uncharacterized protein n=1 Tax=Galerina marginata (strain CBS 339.88) TaxID=685588 RepID=A0A067SN22_GALM3|nr:hypothetical protein GALMADRAFT_229106 [Galerina marginata CBS 339.88]
MYYQTSQPTPQDKISTQAQREWKVRSTFARFLFLYTSPALTFFTVRWFVSAIIGIWNWVPMIRSTDSLSNSPSAAPYVLGSLCAVGVIMFGPLPLFLAIDLVASPESSDPVFILFSVLQIHVFMTVMVIKIYTPPVYMFLSAAVITYPITHVLMHHQFMASGASPAHLGYFTEALSVINFSAILARLQAIFRSEEQNGKVRLESSKERKQKEMDGKSSNRL